MYSYTWDEETGGLLLNNTPLQFSKEPRPVYYREMDILGFDRYFKYDKDDAAPYMWAEANNYIYRGQVIAQTVGGSLFTIPKLNVKEEQITEKNLKMVNLEAMIAKNMDLIEGLSKQTIKDIYNTYKKYVDKVDIFHVSFSGGKDSEVALDLVQKALPHDGFVVIFGDTGMEFPDTYKAVNVAKEKCKELNIHFFIASSRFNPLESWNMFGPPSSSIRWCCSVHKTTPQLLLLREIVGKSDFTEMAFVGVRGDESVRRSGYDYISLGTKHKGQYSCNPILNWNSAEVYLYLYANGLPINQAYKNGISRAGCLFCPMAARKSDYMNHYNYPTESQNYIDIVEKLNCSNRGDERMMKSYLENVGWKARKNGRDLIISPRDYQETINAGILSIHFKNINKRWKIWLKTIGKLIDTGVDDVFKIDYHGEILSFNVISIDSSYSSVSIDCQQIKNTSDFLKKFRRVFRKSHYCVGCEVCSANCRYGNINFDNKGTVSISDNCIHCGQCLEIDTGCLVYKSLWLSNGTMSKKSLDCYATHAPKMEWFAQFLKLGNRFSSENGLGNNQLPAFRRFLKDAGIAINNEDTILGKLFRNEGSDSDRIWACMLTNLSVSPQVGWFIKRFNFDENISQKRISTILVEEENVSKSAEKSIPNSLKRIMALPLGLIGLGTIVSNTKDEGFIVRRSSWQSPDPKVILYSLYKFAEACGGYYQFSLTRLLDTTLESDGVSPSQIFGLDREGMVSILKGLSMNYPEYISTSFTLDLDSINLKEDKTSEDVLNLF